MATDEQLAQWETVTAPVTPGTTQDWAVLVNTDRWPTIDEQKRAIESIIRRLGGKDLEFLRFSNTRIQPSRVRVTRETLPINFVPTVRGRPVWWLIRWNWFGTENVVPWPAEQHGLLTRDIDPSQADVLLDSVGGAQEIATPKPDLVDRIEGIAEDLAEGSKQIGIGIAVIGVLVGAVYVAKALK